MNHCYWRMKSLKKYINKKNDNKFAVIHSTCILNTNALHKAITFIKYPIENGLQSFPPCALKKKNNNNREKKKECIFS